MSGRSSRARFASAGPEHAAGHHHIGKQQIDRLGAAQNAHRCRGIRCRQRAIAELAQRGHDRFAQIGIVLDDEDGFVAARRDLGDDRVLAHRTAASRQRGSRICTVVPRPTWLSIVATPPDCSAKPCTIARPRPLPLPDSLVVKNGSNTRFSTSASMPTPRVADTDRHEVAGLDLRDDRCRTPRRARRSACAPSGVRLGHRIARIDGQIQDRVLELARHRRACATGRATAPCAPRSTRRGCAA